jgi:Fe2+ or Zn2+ uptake regulation protein
VELGLVTRVSHPSSVARYDAKTSRHHHLVCDHCGAVADLESRVLDQLAMPDLSHRGFTMRDFSVHVRGLCERCRPAAGTTRPKDLQAARRPLRAAGAGRHRSKNRSRP